MNAGENRLETQARRSRVPRWLLIGAGAVVLVIVGGIATLKVLFPPDRLRALVVPRIEERVGRDVQLSSVKLQVFPRIAVRLADFSIANPPGFSSEPAVRLDALELQLRFRPLLRRQLEFKEVRLVKPDIRYEVLADGTSNFKGMGSADKADEGQPAGKESAGPSGLVVSQLSLLNGSVFYQDARTDRVARLTVDAQVSADRVPERPQAMQSQGEINLRSIRALIPSMGADSLTLPDVQIDYSLLMDSPGDSLAVPKLAVMLGELPLDGSGAVRGLSGDRAIDFGLASGEIDVAKFLAALPPGLRREGLDASGRASLSITAKGRLAAGKPEIKGSIQLQDLAAAYGEYGQLLTNAAGEVTFDTASLRLPDFQGALWGRPFSLQLKVSNFAAPTLDGRARGSVSLAKLSEVRGQAAPATGDAAFDLSFAGPAREPARLRVTGPLELQNITYKSPSLGVPAQIKATTVRLTGTGVVAERMPVQLGKSDVALSFSSQNMLQYFLSGDSTAAPPPMEFTLTSRFLDLSEILTDTMGYGKLLTARLAGKKLDGREPGEIAKEKYKVPSQPRVRVTGRVQLAELLNPPTRGQNISFNVELANGVLEVKNLAGQLYDGQLTGGLSVDLRPAQAPYPLRYDIHLKGAQATSFVTRWTRLGSAVSGKLDFDITGSAPLDEGLLPLADALAATGRSTINEGQFQDFGPVRALANKLKTEGPTLSDIKQLGGNYRIENGMFILDDWTYSGQNLQTAISGSAGLNGSLNLKLAMKVPPSMLQKAGLLEGGGVLADLTRQLGGQNETLNLAVGVRGTMANPEMQVDSEGLKKELESRLQGKGQDLLKRLIKPPK